MHANPPFSPPSSPSLSFLVRLSSTFMTTDRTLPGWRRRAKRRNAMPALRPALPPPRPRDTRTPDAPQPEPQRATKDSVGATDIIIIIITTSSSNSRSNIIIMITFTASWLLNTLSMLSVLLTSQQQLQTGTSSYKQD